ncbi:hypothetical protein ACG97_05690 [Vogesella sp. EB]|nr:hypothetical protein ACG97_05690 [Vogesella sp. EB]
MFLKQWGEMYLGLSELYKVSNAGHRPTTKFKILSSVKCDVTETIYSFFWWSLKAIRKVLFVLFDT